MTDITAEVKNATTGSFSPAFMPVPRVFHYLYESLFITRPPDTIYLACTSVIDADPDVTIPGLNNKSSDAAMTKMSREPADLFPLPHRNGFRLNLEHRFGILAGSAILKEIYVHVSDIIHRPRDFRKPGYFPLPGTLTIPAGTRVGDLGRARWGFNGESLVICTPQVHGINLTWNRHGVQLPSRESMPGDMLTLPLQERQRERAERTQRTRRRPAAFTQPEIPVVSFTFMSGMHRLMMPSGELPGITVVAWHVYSSQEWGYYPASR